LCKLLAKTLAAFGHSLTHGNAEAFMRISMASYGLPWDKTDHVFTIRLACGRIPGIFKPFSSPVAACGFEGSGEIEGSSGIGLAYSDYHKQEWKFWSSGMSSRNRVINALIFIFTAYMALTYEWKANELCWGLWISSLLTGWVIILSSVLRTLLHLAGIPLLKEEDLNVQGDPLSAYFRTKTFRGTKQPGTKPMPSWSTYFMVAATLGIGLFTFFHFTMFHTIQGLLMSVFVSMEPKTLFGPNGFINADSDEILSYLVRHYWPMILGTFIARRWHIFGGNPGANLKAIYQSVVRIQIFILLSGLLFFLIHFGIETYERFLLLILLFLFFFPIKILRLQ